MTDNDLISYCILYGGERKITDNPNVKEKDEFKWYMWRCEFVAVNNAPNDADEEYIKYEIKCSIDNWANDYAGGEPTEFYNKYFSYK